jgi:hypothetical protein
MSFRLGLKKFFPLLFAPKKLQPPTQPHLPATSGRTLVNAGGHKNQSL